MRVLVLAPRAPYPADHGAALRNLHLLSWLGARHDVTLVAFGDPADLAANAVLRARAREVVILPPPRRSLHQRAGDLVTTGEPDLIRRLWSPDLVAVLRDRLQPPGVDVVHVEGLEMYGMWEAVQAGLPVQPRVVLDAHNAEHALQASAARASLRPKTIVGGVYSLIQAARLRRYESRAGRAADAVIAVSKEDASMLERIGVRGRVIPEPVVVPNGVDVEFYRAGVRKTDGRTALFIGKLDYRPNLDAVEWLCDEIWPRIRARDASARLQIVGRDAPGRIERFGGKNGVSVIGRVPDERPCFDAADLLLVPMRMGGGVRLKVVQAMAMGVPVVATDAGVAGMSVEAGRHYLPANDTDAFANQVVRAFSDPSLRQRVAAYGRQLARESYDWRVILPRLDEIYARLYALSERPIT